MKSLRLRLMLFFSTLLLVTSALLSLVVLRSSENLVKQSLGLQAQRAAEQAVKQIDPAKYITITPETGEDDYYKELRVKLNAIREENGLKYLYTMAKRENGGKTEYIYIVDGMPLDTNKEDFSPLGEVDEEPQELMIRAIDEKEAQIGDLYQDEKYGALLSAYVPILGKSGDVVGVLGADFDSQHVYELMKQNRIKTMWITFLFILVTLALTYFFSRIIVRPLMQLTDAVQKVKAGDLTVTLDVKRKDEVGRLANAFQQMVGDLQGMIRTIRNSSDNILQTSKQIMTEMESAGQASERISDHIKETAVQAHMQRAGSMEMERAIKEVGIGIQKIAESSSVVAESSRISAQEAKNGEVSVRQIIGQMESVKAFSSQSAEEMKSLSASLGHVQQMVEAIRAIAAQTNLLALNAAIEAARAGEQGKGFAVVAEHIRKLAVQSQESVDRISEDAELIRGGAEGVIDAMDQERSVVEQGLASILETGESIYTILEEIEKVAEQAQEVSAVSQEVAAGAEQVEASVGQITHISNETTDRVEHISSASEEQAANMRGILSYTESLEKMSEQLNLMVERFKL